MAALDYILSIACVTCVTAFNPRFLLLLVLAVRPLYLMAVLQRCVRYIYPLCMCLSDILCSGVPVDRNLPYSTVHLQFLYIAIVAETCASNVSCNAFLYIPQNGQCSFKHMSLNPDFYDPIHEITLFGASLNMPWRSENLHPKM